MRQKFINFITLKGFSKNTINNYTSIFDLVMKDDPLIFNENEDNIISYLCKKVEKHSQSYVSQYVSVFNIVIKNILKRESDIHIPRSKRPVKQPDILSSIEIEKLLKSIENIKHKAIVALMYATGLRVSEACNLKITDIDTENGFISVRKAKGDVERKVMLDSSLLMLLRKYFKEYRPNNYLFNGSKGNEYSDRSVQQIIKRAAANAGIKKNISSHSMRHSCFTQLLRNGVDIRSIQKLAGHKNISTTARYLQICDNDVLSIISPINIIKL